MADNQEHNIEMINRRNISLSGIKNIKEFSENRVILETVMGGLHIRGKKLTVSRLNTDTGLLDVSGEIDLLKYTSSAGGGVIEGLFK